MKSTISGLCRLARALPGAAAVLALASGALAATLPARSIGAPESAPVVRPAVGAAPAAAASPAKAGSGLTWTDAPIDATGDVGAMLSVAGLGASSVPHVSYYDATSNGGNLKYATLNASGAWVTETVVNTANDEGNVTSIAVDGANLKHIIHYNQTTSTWHHMWRLGVGGWSSQTIENLGVPGAFGMDSGLGYDPINFKLYAAYPNVGGTGMRFANCVSVGGLVFSWSITSYDVGLNFRDVDMVVSADGDAHLAYTDTDSSDLHYAVRDAGGGFTSQVAQTDLQCSGCTVAIAVDSQERPHIVYPRSEAGTTAATHTWLDGGTWFKEDLETGTVFNDFEYFSLQIDPFDNLHVSYHNNVTQQLRYAKKVGGSWSFEDVTPMAAGSGGKLVGLYLRGSCPSIVHYDPTSGDLEFASLGGGSTHLVPGDHGTIREALAFACDGDVVRVAAGTYVETGELDFDGKELDLVSEDGPEATVVQLSGAELVRLDQTPGFGGPVRLEGLTIEGGRGVRSDGNGDATITNCIVRASDDSTGSTGSALTALRTNLTVSDSRFSGNNGNGFGTIGLASTSQISMAGCTVAGNKNSATGGIYVVGSSTLNLERCIVWGNCGGPSSTEEILVEGFGTLNATDCVIDATGVGGGGTINYISGNVFTDPLFCGPVLCPGAPTTAGDYTLNLDSPALAANHSSGQLVGAHGLGCGLLFDVDGFTSPASETEAGYLRLTAPGMSGDGSNGAYNATGTYGGIVVTASAANGWRDRGIPPNQQLVPQVLRDFVYSEGAEGSQIVVTISGLPAGGYEVTSYHHDWFVWANVHPFDILVDDAAGTARLVVNNADYTSAADYPGATYIVVADGAGDVIIRIREDSSANSVRFNGLVLNSAAATSVGGPVVDSPRRFDLMAAAPNPFRDRTSVGFAMPRAGLVRLDVYDVAGRRVRSLVDRSLEAGAHRAEWDGRFDSGASAGAGIYFFRLDTGDYQETRKVVFIK